MADLRLPGPIPTALPASVETEAALSIGERWGITRQVRDLQKAISRQTVDE